MNRSYDQYDPERDDARQPDPDVPEEQAKKRAEEPDEMTEERPARPETDDQP